MNGRPGWTSDLESYTEHAATVRELDGQRLHGDGLRKTVPVEYIPNEQVRGAVDAIEGATSTGDDLGRRLPGLLLPGFGENPDEAPELYRDDCGDDLPYGCMDCGWTEVVGRTCRVSRCPRCAASWTMDRCIDPLASLLDTRRELDRERSSHQRLHHIVVSPAPGERFDVDPDEPDREVLDVAWSTAKRVLAELGIKHGYGMFHGYRGSDEHQVAPGEDETPDDRGAWKGRLFQGEGSESLAELIARELEESPHFHVIGIGNRLEGGELTRALEAATGWVVHRITPNNTNVSLYDAKDAARALTYCMSHTSLYVDPGGNYRAFARPFGRVADNKPPEAVKEDAEDIIRRADVAPVTLGINPSELECPGPTELEVDDILGDAPRATTAAIDAGGVRSPAPAPARDGAEAGPGELPAESGAWDAPGGGSTSRGADELEDVDESAGEDVDRWEGDFDPDDRCGGRMRPIWAVAKQLDNPEWVEAAAFADRLREDVLEWSDELEGLDPPD